MSTLGPALADDERCPVAYQPPRRPIAEGFRRTANAAAPFCLRRGIHPDTISYLGIAASGLAGLCFWRSAASPWLLFVAPLLCYVRLWFDMLDGTVAVASGRASARGEVINDFPVRISDLLIFTGVAHSGLCSPYGGYWAAIFALLTAYVATLGQAVGVQRQFSGLMAKPWRIVLLHAGAWCAVAAGPSREAQTVGGALTILDWTCLLIVVGCIQTIAVRLRRILATLQTRTTGGAR